MRILGNAKLCQAAVVAAGIVALTASDALAWGHRGSYGGYGSSGSYASYGSSGGYASYGSSGGYASYGSSGGYASYGSSGSSASYGSYGSYGNYDSSGSSGGGGMFSRWHARKAARASYGSSGSYASSGSSGGYSVSYSGSYGSYGSYGSSGSSGGVVYEGAVYDGGMDMQQAAPMSTEPPAPPTPADAGAAPTTPEASPTPAAGPSASSNEATIWVNLPTDAKVFVNDLATKSLGAERHYVSRGLEQGRTYSYKLRVEYQQEGKPMVEDKMVRLQAGASVQLAFGKGESANQAEAKTELTLHVPEQAKVTLAGAATKQTGEVRTYATSGLKPGQHWDSYTVKVEMERDGKTLVEEKTLSIVGGKTYELSFDMHGDTAKVASAN